MVSTEDHHNSHHNSTATTTVGSPKSHGRGFLDLPAELRRQIYRHVLVVEHILVGEWSEDTYLVDKIQWDREKWPCHRDFGGANVNLLFTCRLIHSEAADVFYGLNQFYFCGEHAYEAEVQWLRQIGPSNRGYLAQLDIYFRMPSTCWQYPDGTREGFTDGFISYDSFHARCPLLQKPDYQNWPEGVVHDVDPDLEAIFCLLGNVEHAKSRAVHVILHNERYFNTRQPFSKHAPGYHFPEDIPALVEAWRSMYSATRRIEVSWQDYTVAESKDHVTRYYESAGYTVVDRTLSDGDQMLATRLKYKPYKGEPIIGDLTYDDDYGPAALFEADERRYGLWKCEVGSVHRDGDVCKCAEGGYRAPQTSMARHKPVWPDMPRG